MIKYQILFFVFLMSIVNLSCQDKEIKLLETYTNGKVKVLIEYVNPKDTTDIKLIGFYESGDTNFIYPILENQKNGISKYFYENGQLKYEINYRNDQFHGESKFWYPNGQLWQQATYDNGQLVGTLTDYYENGKLKSLCVYKNGEGNAKYYHPNGQLWKTGKTLNDKEIGNWTYYYTNGVKSSEGSYKNGLRHGDYKKYYKSGELMENGIYNLNVITQSTHYFKNGNIDSKTTNFINKNRNLLPWTEEQKKTFLSKCINDKLKENKTSGDDYCNCIAEKLELFWSYNDYMKATEQELKESMKLIDKLCDNE